MRRYILVLVASFLMVSGLQAKYDVGTSVVSIEPTGETVSLALAGYAGPTMGRFTITWDDRGEYADILCLTGDGNQIYGLHRNGDLTVLESSGPKTIKMVGNVHPVRFIAGFKGELYGITANGDLMIGNPLANTPWKKHSHIQGVAAFASSDENLYVATDKGELLIGTVSGGTIEWKNIGPAKNITGMAADKNRLYAITADNFLLQRHLKKTDEAWQRIGYKNGETYNIDVKQIAYANGKLYALAANNHLYTSRHQTEGKLSARAMAIRKGANTVVIASVDVCGLDYSFTQSIKKEIARRKGIAEEAMMINSSHTHFAPTSQKWLTWGIQNQLPDSLYLNHVVRKGIIQAIEEAIDNAVPSSLSFARDTTDIGFNRSLKGELAIYDNAVDVIQAVSADGKNRSVLFLSGCHPVFTNVDAGHLTANANFPGYARELVERTGINTGIFLQGCAGDINPKHPFKMSGLMLGTDVIRALGKKLSPVRGGISYALDSVAIPVFPWTKEQVQAFRSESSGAAKTGTPGGPESDGAGRNVRWADIMMGYYENNSMPAYMPVYIQTINIGNWKLIGISREATTEFGLAIKKLWPDKKVSVVAYTNDVASYLSTDPHIVARDYEGYDSFFWYGQPSPFPLGVFNTVVETIKRNNR